MKSVLITGATGYLGSKLTEYFVSSSIEVHIIVRVNSNFNLLEGIMDKINVHVLSGDSNELVNLIGKIKPDTIFHLAALFISEHKSEDIKALLESNIFFGTQLLEAACKAGVKYFINTGTHWQNYDSSEFCPSNLYAATKEAFESIASYYTSAFDIRFVTIKLLDTYGPFDPRKKVMSVLKGAAISGKKIKMSGGKQQLGFLYIDDVIKAFLLAAQYAHKMPSHTKKNFMASPKEIHSLKEITRIFEKAFACKLNIDFGKRPYGDREVMNICCKDENILSDFDTIGVYDGLRKVFVAESVTASRVKL